MQSSEQGVNASLFLNREAFSNEDTTASTGPSALGPALNEGSLSDESYLQIMQLYYLSGALSRINSDVPTTGSHKSSNEECSEPERKRARTQVSCPHCPKLIRSDKLLAHICSHTGDKPFKCEECDKSFARKDKLVVHYRIHTGERPYICYCGKEFTRQDKCKRHIATHPKLEILQNQDKIIAPRHECMISNIFKNEVKVEGPPKQKALIVSKSDIICPQCGDKFQSEKFFERHLKIHAGPKSLKDIFKCPCGREFRSLKWLTNHQTREKCPEAELSAQISIEGNDKPEICSVVDGSQLNERNQKSIVLIKTQTSIPMSEEINSHCSNSDERTNITPHENKNEVFSTNDETDKVDFLQLIPELTSTEVVVEKSSHKTGLECNECHKLFPNKSKLTTHQRIHTGERPYDCCYCGKAFSRKDHLLKHLDTHKKFQSKSEKIKCIQPPELPKGDPNDSLLDTSSLTNLFGISLLQQQFQAQLRNPSTTISENFLGDNFSSSFSTPSLQSIIEAVQNRSKLISTKETNLTPNIEALSSELMGHSSGNLVGVNNYLNLLSNSISEEKKPDIDVKLSCPVCQLSVFKYDFKEHLFNHSERKTDSSSYFTNNV